MRFDTTLGNIDFEMLDQQKPLSVTNFLGYVNRGDYNSTLVHRSGNISGNHAGPRHVLQGGGFAFPGFGSIVDQNTPTVPNEFTTNGIVSNVRGTVAYAKSPTRTCATSQWFINITNDASVTSFLDNPSSSGGFTVFARVVNGTLDDRRRDRGRAVLPVPVPVRRDPAPELHPAGVPGEQDARRQ